MLLTLLLSRGVMCCGAFQGRRVYLAEPTTILGAKRFRAVSSSYTTATDSKHKVVHLALSSSARPALPSAQSVARHLELGMQDA